MGTPAPAKKDMRIGDAYLVVARTNLDEIPLALCATLEHARLEAKAVTEDEIYRIANDIMNVDSAGMCSIAVIAFLGGKPIDMECV